MGELPFLVVYGAIVAKVLVAGMTVAILGLVWRTRKKRDAEQARRELGARLERVVAPVEGEATGRGTLRERGGRRWLDCAGERIDLEGEVHVVRGTHATWRRRQAAASHSVRDGDDVIAFGRVTRRPGDEDTASSYRSAVTAWTMAPATGIAAIDLVASQPAVCARLPGWRWLIASALISYCALYGAGQLAGASVPRSGWTVGDTGGTLGAFAITSTAAALPGARDDALEVLDDRSYFLLPRRRDTIEMRIVLARLRHGCHGEASRLLTENLFERAHAVAMSCGDKKVAAKALLELGRYEEAARLVPIGDWGEASQLAGNAMLGAGRWSDAAVLADLRAARSSIYGARWDSPGVTRDFCLGDLFRAYGGDPHAVERIHARAQSTNSAACTEFEALAAGRVDTWIDDLLGQGHDERFAEPPVTALMDGSEIPWLAPFSTRDSISHRKWMAVYHMYNNDFAAAWQDVVALRSAAPDDDLELAFQVSSGEPVEPARGLADPSKLSLDRVVRFPYYEYYGPYIYYKLSSAMKYLSWTIKNALEPPGCHKDNRIAYGAAMSGNGELLTSLIEYCEYIPSHEYRTIVAVLPYVVLHREELCEAVRWFRMGDERRSWAYDEGVSPFRLVFKALALRDLMRVAGHAELAARWQEIVERHAKILADRDRVIALTLWPLLAE